MEHVFSTDETAELKTALELMNRQRAEYLQTLGRVRELETLMTVNQRALEARVAVLVAVAGKPQGGWILAADGASATRPERAEGMRVVA